VDIQSGDTQQVLQECPEHPEREALVAEVLLEHRTISRFVTQLAFPSHIEGGERSVEDYVELERGTLKMETFEESFLTLPTNDHFSELEEMSELDKNYFYACRRLESIFPVITGYFANLDTPKFIEKYAEFLLFLDPTQVIYYYHE
jgi:hypothetical protein